MNRCRDTTVALYHERQITGYGTGSCIRWTETYSYGRKVYMFFEKLLDFAQKHWAVDCLVFAGMILYLILSIWIGYRFCRQLGDQIWYQRMCRVIDYWPYVSRWMIGMVVILLCIAFALLTLPILWFLVRKAEASKVALAEAMRLEQQRQADIVEKEKRRENERREADLRVYFKDHQPVLYYNTIDGITAVLRPSAFQQMVVKTRKACLDGKCAGSRLLPCAETVVFVTQQGLERMQTNIKDDTLVWPRIAGWYSEFDDFVSRHKIKLIHDANIFVPWVNGNRMSLLDQRQHFSTCYKLNLYEYFVLSQVPKELRPI